METTSFISLIASIMLSSAAQILLKLGMNSQAVQTALSGGSNVTSVAFLVARNPAVVLGLCSFALSLIVWLLVLSRIDVSRAYPCVALGIVFTVIAGHVLFGERVPLSQIAGLIAISTGVLLVAFSR